jgi:hypothetical protein
VAGEKSLRRQFSQRHAGMSGYYSILKKLSSKGENIK